MNLLEQELGIGLAFPCTKISPSELLSFPFLPKPQEAQSSLVFEAYSWL